MYRPESDRPHVAGRISGMLFGRAANAGEPEGVARRQLAALRADDCLTADLVFRDPYVLDFLRLEGAYSKQHLELAILRELESFLRELGWDFSFVARQKPITGRQGRGCRAAAAAAR
jgi:predicted nuclease of restriction endonuclease-like (RecB) superfamily